MRATRCIVLVACVAGCADDRAPMTPSDARPVDMAESQNLAPIADAGPDTQGFVGRSIDLDGSGSTDADGTLVAFQWALVDRPAASVATLANDTATLAVFVPDTAGSYTFSLAVTDDDGASASDTVTIVVEPGAFTVDAGPDQTVVWQSTVQLAGSYVSESGPGTVTWRVLSSPPPSPPILQPAASLTPTFFAGKVGAFIAEMEVTSPAGTATDTVTITVIAPPPDPIDGNIVDVVADGYTGQFAIASTNPSRIRMLAPYWPTPPSEMVIPLTVTPTNIGLDHSEQFVYVIHDTTRLTVAWITALSQRSTMDLGVAILEVRGEVTPRMYPAQAGPLVLIDHDDDLVYPGGLVPGPVRGRELQSGERSIYTVDVGVPNAKIRRYDGNAEDTTFVREWPYPGGQYALGNDLWVLGYTLITSAGTVFHASEDPLVDMTLRGSLAGDQPFEIVGVCDAGDYIATLHNRITAPPQLPESQVRFYDPTTLALVRAVSLPDLVVGGVAQRAIGHSITVHAFPGRVYVIGSAVAAPASAALFTIPTP